ncbi:hypothetical protein GGR50DRAFT_219028 [Xylaria sp. CBS 124048]|nr:hypothetical protein GGR50DRAFT_219028 [Xylaria sp. CBS 124048]
MLLLRGIFCLKALISSTPSSSPIRPQVNILTGFGLGGGRPSWNKTIGRVNQHTIKRKVGAPIVTSKPVALWTEAGLHIAFGFDQAVSSRTVMLLRVSLAVICHVVSESHLGIISIAFTQKMLSC